MYFLYIFTKKNHKITKERAGKISSMDSEGDKAHVNGVVKHSETPDPTYQKETSHYSLAVYNRGSAQTHISTYTWIGTITLI